MIESDYILPMILMMTQGILGAIDTVYYHEYRYRLPAYAEEARTELQLHNWRDLIYGVLFISLPRYQWSGYWAWLLAFLIMAEIVITLVDFVIEREIRQAWGGLAAGELCMHAIMAILYGAFIITLLPHWLGWTQGATQFLPQHSPLAPGNGRINDLNGGWGKPRRSKRPYLVYIVLTCIIPLEICFSMVETACTTLDCLHLKLKPRSK